MTTGSRTMRLSLRFRDWPASDRDAWAQAVSAGTALLDAGAGAHWREATRIRYRWSYGAWLSFLGARNLLIPEAMPAARVSEDLVVGFIDDMRGRDLASTTVASHVQALHNTLWATASEQDWTWLREIVNFLVRNARPAPSDQSRIHPIDEVYAAALHMMDQADRMIPRRPLQDSIWFRDGLLAAVTAATALRRRNLALLELGRHLTRQSDGWYLAIPGEEVKNYLPIEGPLARSLGPYLDRYTEQHRPRLLAGRPSSHLWINQYGHPLSIHQFSSRLLKITTRLGYPMRTHDFRRSAATTIADARPDLARTIGQFLGHRSQHTSEIYYNKAQMLVSARRHARTVTELKAKLRPADAAAP